MSPTQQPSPPNPRRSRQVLRAPQSKAHRLWIWPLRSGLMTVLAVTGWMALFGAACGGRVDANGEPGASGGGVESGPGGATSTSHALNGSGGTASSKTSTSLYGLGGANAISLGNSAGSGTTVIVLPPASEGGMAAHIDCPSTTGGTPSIFADQEYNPQNPRPTIVYSWTTLEQAEALRQGGALFSRSERPGVGRGNARESLAKLASRSDDQGQLAALLNQQVFATARYGWTNPWATRMGWPGEEYGNQLIRIELREEAWQVNFEGDYLRIVDGKGSPVPIADAIANPKRIATLLYLHEPEIGGPNCGTFGYCYDNCLGTSYREIVIGNTDMVKRWSLGTSEIESRIKDDTERLDRLASFLQTCDLSGYGADWIGQVVCGWSWAYGAPDPVPQDYLNSLAFPNDFYKPTPENIRRIIDTLKADPFILNPYVVEL